jgi:hypothetical protein
MKAKALVLIFCLSISIHLMAQDSLSAPSLFQKSEVLNKKRRNFVVGGELLVGGVTFAGLDRLWYSEYPRSALHLFNDNDEWLQMDKFGHAQTSYSLGQTGYNLLKWAGVKEKNAMWYGGSLGLMFTTVVEVFDGLSSQWGFSMGDLAADAAGTVMFIGEQALWKEQRVLFKFTFMPSPYAKYRPNVLGKDITQQWLKDYNGQTYWFCIDIGAFLPKTTTYPKWLNLAIGYGADGMTGGSFNPLVVNGKSIPYFDRRRQVFLSFDVNLNKIDIKNKFLKAVCKSIGFIKIPAPTVEFLLGKGVYFHPLYF